jgi:hypothetical protein
LLLGNLLVQLLLLLLLLVLALTYIKYACK